MERCVDTRINNCHFGYGGIQVVANHTILIFRGIKPPIGAGNHLMDSNYNKIGEWEYTGDQLYIPFDNMDEINQFCTALEKIEEDKGGFFKFKDIILDFTHYSQKSMEIVKMGMKRVRLNMTLLIAC